MQNRQMRKGIQKENWRGKVDPTIAREREGGNAFLA
jgi:hypothetical protein